MKSNIIYYRLLPNDELEVEENSASNKNFKTLQTRKSQMDIKFLMGDLQTFRTLPHASFSERYQPVTVTAGCMPKGYCLKELFISTNCFCFISISVPILS